MWPLTGVFSLGCADRYHNRGILGLTIEVEEGDMPVCVPVKELKNTAEFTRTVPSTVKFNAPFA